MESLSDTLLRERRRSWRSKWRRKRKTVSVDCLLKIQTPTLPGEVLWLLRGKKWDKTMKETKDRIVIEFKSLKLNWKAHKVLKDRKTTSPKEEQLRQNWASQRWDPVQTTSASNFCLVRSFDETGSQEVFGVTALQIDQQLRTISEETKLSRCHSTNRLSEPDVIFLCVHLFSFSVFFFSLPQ